MRKRDILISAASFAAIAAGNTAYAQAGGSASATAQPSDGLEDIIVTARKVEENLQRVPVAVTVLSGALLQQQSARQVPDIALTTPGLTAQTGNSSATSSNFAIRGQIQPDPLATQDPSVGIYVDDFYWARVYGINSNLLDIRSVQVLKGPQGTLFGRNTTGGAILMGTNNPSFSEGLSATGTATYGNRDYGAGSVVVNAPLVDDVIAARVAFQLNRRGGYMTELNSGRSLGALNDYTVRGKLLIQPSSTFRVILSGEQFRTSFLAPGFQGDYFAPTSPGNIEAGVEASGGACFGGGVVACSTAGASALGAAINEQRAGDSTRLGQLPYAYAKTNTYTMTATLDTSWGALKAVGGYRRVRSRSDIDLDGTGFNILASRLTQDLKQWSFELQATGKALDDSIDFAGGVFVFREFGRDGSTSIALPALNPTTNAFEGEVDTHSIGLYGQATWHITDRLGFTGGLRYSVDDKELISNNLSYTGVSFGSPPVGGVPTCQVVASPVVGQPCPRTPRTASFDGISYTAGLDYKVTEDVLAYAKVARGFRGGGHNLRGTGVFPGSTTAFGPETATSYEGGLKSELFDRHLRVNLAGYYTQDKDVQFGTTAFNTSGQSATYITNAGQINFWGVELEVAAILPASFRLDGTFAYADYKIVSNIDPNTGFDRTSARQIAAPKWKASLSPSWSHEFDAGRFALRGDFSYESDFATLSNDYYLDAAGQAIDAITGAVTPLADQQAFKRSSTDEGHLLINARASMTVMDGMLELAVWGRNLSNVRDRVASLVVSQLGFSSSIRREPRTFGITGTVKIGR